VRVRSEPAQIGYYVPWERLDCHSPFTVLASRRAKCYIIVRRESHSSLSQAPSPFEQPVRPIVVPVCASCWIGLLQMSEDRLGQVCLQERATRAPSEAVHTRILHGVFRILTGDHRVCASGPLSGSSYPELQRPPLVDLLFRDHRYLQMASPWCLVLFPLPVRRLRKRFFFFLFVPL
jgi:hypothetical protein